MTTTRELLDRIRRELLVGRNEPLNKLNGAVTDTDTTVTLAYDLGGIQSAARLGIGLEDLYVFESNTAAQTATVQRGYEGTAATAHDDGEIVRVNPRYTDAQILRALNSELRSLWAKGVYRMLTTELTANPAAVAYELPADALEVHDVLYSSPADLSEWIRLLGWRQTQAANDTDFTSGNSLTFLAELPAPGQVVHVQYRAELGQLTALGETVETVTGTQAIDLLTIGTVLRLGRSREMSRSFSETQGPTRRAEEVPPGAEMGANRDLMRSYQRELSAERSRLLRLYGMRSRR